MKTFWLTMLSFLCFVGGLYAQDEVINDTVYMTVAGNYLELTVAFLQGTETDVYIATGDGSCKCISKGNDTVRWWYYYNYEGEYQIKLFATSGDLKSRLFGLDFRRDVDFTSLDVSGCTALQRLRFGWMPLNSLDVSGCTSLTHLDCQARVLDASGCASLMHLDCQASVLDVSGCSSLTYLRCVTFDTLTSLNVSDCVALDTLVCNGGLTSLDVSQNTALAYLDCENNQLTSLNISQNRGLTRLSCGRNQLTSLDVSQNMALAYLDCENNQLESLDVSGCKVLETLKCNNNRLITLDLSKNEALRTLECRNNYREVILDNQGCLNLGTLSGFEAGKAKDWSGGVLSGNTLKFQQGRVGYAYPTNNPLQPFINFYFIDNSPVAMPQIVLMFREAVFISTRTPDAVIYYTMDGSVPTEFSQRYEGGGIKIAGAVTVKAIAVKDGVKSPVAMATFESVSAEDVTPASTLRVYVQDRTIYLSEPVGEVEVFAVSGHRVYRGVSMAIPVPRAGIYVVSAAGRKFKVGVR